jgi:hypothetical protein
VNWISSLSGSVSLKLNVGVVDTPVAPDAGAVRVGVLGAKFAGVTPLPSRTTAASIPLPVTVVALAVILVSIWCPLEGMVMDELKIWLFPVAVEPVTSVLALSISWSFAELMALVESIK